MTRLYGEAPQNLNFAVTHSGTLGTSSTLSVFLSRISVVVGVSHLCLGFKAQFPTRREEVKKEETMLSEGRGDRPSK